MNTDQRIDRLERLVYTVLKKELSAPVAAPAVKPQKDAQKSRQEALSLIDKVEFKHGLGKYKEADKAQSVPSVVEDVLMILRRAFSEDPSKQEDEAFAEIQKMLSSQENPLTTSKQQVTDAMAQDFLREVRQHDYGRS